MSKLITGSSAMYTTNVTTLFGLSDLDEVQRGTVSFDGGDFEVQFMDDDACVLFGVENASQFSSLRFPQLFRAPKDAAQARKPQDIESRLKTLETHGTIDQVWIKCDNGKHLPVRINLTRQPGGSNEILATIELVQVEDPDMFPAYRTNTATTPDAYELQRQLQQMQQTHDAEKHELMAKAEVLQGELDEVRNMLQIKDEFLATMSHELRTPLNAILGLVESMREGVYGHLTPKSGQPLTHIENSGKMMLSLINDVLDISKIQANRMELSLEQLEVFDLCQASLAMVQPQARQKGVKVVFRNDPRAKYVTVDRRRTQQVLVNLLTNAVKFTSPNGKIGLAVKAHERTSQLQFIVADTGVGIDEDTLSKLFTPFVQASSGPGTGQEGTGLGLVLVKKIAELHNGYVRVRSAVGRGSEFSVFVPWNTEDMSRSHQMLQSSALVDVVRDTDDLTGTAGASAVAERDAKTNLPTILLAEDNENNIAVVKDYLVAKNMNVITALNGVEALKFAREYPPDVILMDIHMPEMDGLEAIRRLRSVAATATVPIIALTGIAMPGDQERCLNAGADAYMSKPVRLRQLHEEILGFMARR